MLLKCRFAPLLACLLLTGCTLLSTTSSAQITPVPTVTLAHRSSLFVQYCVDDTNGYSGGYPRQEFSDANAYMAKQWVQAVAANSDSRIMWASLIKMTYDATNTLPPFVVPTVGNYPMLPTPVPTPVEANPVSYSATATASADQNTTGIVAYNTAVAQTNSALTTTKSQVASDVQRLATWNPPIDPGQPSIWGCIQLARGHLAAQTGTKYLIIASQMIGSTNDDYTSDITSTRSLAGVHVHVIFRANCADAEDCQYWTTTWTNVFNQAGAASVQFDDSSGTQAITNIFGGN
jgi:hypothetical protein